MSGGKYLVAKEVYHYLLDEMDMSFEDVEILFFELDLPPQIDGRVMLCVEDLKKHLPDYVVEGMIRGQKK